MKATLFLLACSVSLTWLNAQRKGYWQQQADYVMEVALDPKNHQLEGSQTIRYTNNASDTLRRVYYHLYFNAFQPNSVMDYRSRHLPDPDRRVADRIQKLKEEEQGWHRISSFRCRGEEQAFTILGTVMEIPLSKPILPGETVALEMEFKSQVPIQIRRSGRNSSEGIDYSMTQWYPKLAAFDEDGWHTDPYIAREFYGNFGRFDVKITLPSEYVVGATGVLQNAEEVGHGYSKAGNKAKNSGGKNTLQWHFVAENVHDFAWAADPDYAHKTLQVTDGPLLHFLYLPKSNEDGKWDKLQPLCRAFFEEMNKTFGPYPYPQFSFVQGGDGGMEYPMLTLITASGDLSGLVHVAFHEAIHNWFYGIFGFHEGRYPWLDEGFTTYATDLMVHEVYEAGEHPFYWQSYQAYRMMVSDPNRQPMSTHADWYNQNRSYSLSSYIGGAVFLNQLRYILGEDAFQEGMQRFYRHWKFKHPKPEDFMREMERAGQMELDWYHREFIFSTHTIDYAIDSVWSEGNKTRVRLERKGLFPMPIDLAWKRKNGPLGLALIPLDVQRGVKTPKRKWNEVLQAPAWEWVRTYYEIELPVPINDLEVIMIDPDQLLADQDPKNNLWQP